jgi:hypothetical protein
MPLLSCLAPGTQVEIIKNFSWGPWLLIGAQHLSPIEGSAHFMGGLPVSFCVIGRNPGWKKVSTKCKWLLAYLGSVSSWTRHIYIYNLFLFFLGSFFKV